MNAEALKKHIFDTIKEWQIKLGYIEEDMKLYYPAESLKVLLFLISVFFIALPLDFIRYVLSVYYTRLKPI